MDATNSQVQEQGVDEPPEGLYQFDRTVNKRVPTISDLTEKDLGFFQEHGYIVIDEFLNEDEVEAAKDGMLSLLTEAYEDDGEIPGNVINFEPGLADEINDPANVQPELLQNYVRKFWKFSDYSERMAAPSRRADLVDLLSTLIDGEPEMFQDMALAKPPGGSEKPWHQDKAYFTVDLDAPVVGVWIALDPATAENGCMHIIPGSHRGGPVVHFDRRDWQICDTDVQVNKDVMATLDPGGALLFDGLIHHGTPPNNSDQGRRALQFHYTAADAKWLEERNDAFGNTDKDVEC